MNFLNLKIHSGTQAVKQETIKVDMAHQDCHGKFWKSVFTFD